MHAHQRQPVCGSDMQCLANTNLETKAKPRPDRYSHSGDVACCNSCSLQSFFDRPVYGLLVAFLCKPGYNATPLLVDASL
mmetsp:Transcript_103334/g.246103  ORF Transcript_103334/g.246103 Transcript_103334/m.246103 type:complete len:80 (-) Transcript_103334:175-414(-)